MLILDVTENLFNKVLKRDHAGCASELVDNNRNRAFFGQQAPHHFICHQGFRGKDHRLETFPPFTTGGEQLTDMDIAENVVDILPVDNDF